MKKVLTLMLALVLSLTLVGCGGDDEVVVPDTSVEDLADAVQKLSLDVADALAVTADITLQDSGLHDAVITWSSSNTDVISNAGVVTRPAIGAGNASVTLTATVTIGDAVLTKDFALKVLELVPSLDVTIAGLNSSDIAVGDVVVVTGVIFAFVAGKGIEIFDETGFLYVYNGGDVDASLKLGDKVMITGEKGNYFGLPQVAFPTEIKLVDSDNAAPTYEVTSIVDLFDEDAYDTIYWSKPIQVTGMVKVEDDNAVIVATDADGMSYDVVVYYASDADKVTELKALAGKVVTADVITYGYHDGMGAWRVIIASDAVFTSTDPTDAQLAAYEAGQLSLGALLEVMDNLTLSTTGMIAGTTISWASDNEAVISTAGVVTRVSGSDTTVVLTATVTVGSETATKVFTAVVSNADANLVTITVAEAMLLADDEEVVVKAIVAGFNYANRVFFQDADGTGIYIHATVDGVEVGDEVIVRATMSSYNDIRQFTDLTLVSVVSQGNAVFANTTATPAEIGDATAIATTQNRLYTMTLTVATLEDGSYTLYTGNGTSFFSSYTSGSYLRDILVDGDTITYTFFVTGLAGTNIKMEIIDTVLTAAQTTAAVESMIMVSGDVTADLELTTALADYDAVITWASDNAAVTNMGVVTQPAVGEADVTVTLTASVVVGTEAAVDYTFTVTVKALVEAVVVTGPTLFFSEYGDGPGGSCKYVEIYNPTDAAIDLSTYTIVKGGNGKLFSESTDIDTLSGTLAAGAVIVVGNAGCLDAADASQDAAVSTPTFPLTGITFVPSTVVGYINGDDAIGLFNNGVLIDVIGTNGTDPGTEWPVGLDNLTDGSTADTILIRSALVTAGETDWAVGAMQWIVVTNARDYSNVGVHTFTPATT